MTTLFRNYATILMLSLLLIVLALAWFFPALGPALGIAFLFVSLTLAAVGVVLKQRDLYRQGKLSRAMFVRTTVLEIAGSWLTMLLAVLLARYIASHLIRQLDDDLLRFLAGIVIGLLAGLVVGTVVSGAWKRIVKLPSI